MRVLVVDDEAPARRRLSRLLARIDGLEVAGEAADGVEAHARVTELRPDLVLLDVDMPEMDGLSFAAEHPELTVVFVTAHAEHAVEAFDLEAVDYLLKPVAEARLRQAVDRVRARASAPDPARIARALEPLLRSEAPPTPRVTTTEGTTARVFDARQVERFTATQKLVAFTHEGTEHLVDESLTQLEQRLAPHDFMKVHRAELVNLSRVRALHREDGAAELELQSGDRVPVSRRLLPELERRLGLRE